MKYNTEGKKLVMPEYGRNIQNMVDYCLAIEDRTERKRCADTIINIMGNMFPHLRDVNDFKHILWDHLAIMADFKLDIDYPYEIIKKEDLHSRPPRIPYNNSRIRYRHYGKTLELMIDKATGFEEEGEEKKQLVNLLANHMKKSFLTWNKESVDDRKIFKDLEELSKGKIVLDEEVYKLTESRDILARNNNNTNNNNNKKNYSRKGR
ncbi:DUF4290 domain-containing protein [Parabacteroides sp. 52]|uniref:DUF4290 domain-containing protein n=1 Tax=unclassified Parabacteroides TaxID=2649774 RepID=UPI0013CFBC0F|nr:MULTISPECIES: DUF4290 domain-containing protein [unclassified Parabacteroides]MDH6533959.1 hypothetical protein [Parabacteroides sp. PM5-20]NDV54702.1 DUF4290 domain-containing protein [Parabacteroides sp. 52]